MREKQGNLCIKPPRTSVPLDPIMGCCFPDNPLLFKWAFFAPFFDQAKKVQKEILTLKKSEKRSVCLLGKGELALIP